MVGIPECDFGVFPACAGMFQAAQLLHAYRIRFPRVRGDVPGVLRRNRHHQLFSPRARGCSPLRMASHQLHLVFPACAGMFLGKPKIFSTEDLFSPRARGCSALYSPVSGVELVFPACAGMFPNWFRMFSLLNRFPRVRGDVPGGPFHGPHLPSFSPRARGCSSRMPSCGL